MDHAKEDYIPYQIRRKSTDVFKFVWFVYESKPEECPYDAAAGEKVMFSWTCIHKLI